MKVARPAKIDETGHMRNTVLHKLGLTLIAGLLAAFALSPAALAQDSGDPSSAQYDPPIPVAEDTAASTAVGGDSADSGGTSGLSSSIGSLPFTGLDLLIVGGIAFVLTGTGFALRRLSTPRGPGV